MSMPISYNYIRILYNILSVSDVVCFLYPYHIHIHIHPYRYLLHIYIYVSVSQSLPPSLALSLFLFLSLSLSLSLSVCLSLPLSRSVTYVMYQLLDMHTSAFIICLGKHTVPIRYFAFPVMISAASFLLGLGIQNYCQQQN